MKGILWVMIGISTLLVSPVRAHHSPAAYDSGQVVAFEGNVLRFEWKNPHVYIVIEDIARSSG
jgi:hypothetical protein